MFNTICAGEGTPTLDDPHRIDVNTGRVQTLLVPGWGGNFVISPDGAWVAAVDSRAVHLLDTHGGQVRRNLVSYPSGGPFRPRPVWSSDSAWFLVTVPSASRSYYDGEVPPQGRLWRVPPGGGAPTRLALSPPPAGDQAAQASPDLRWLAYPRLEVPETMQVGVYIAEGEGGNGSTYAAGRSLRFHGWGGESKYFVFSTEAEGKTLRLHLGRPGAEPEVIGVGRFAGWIDGGGTSCTPTAKDASACTTSERNLLPRLRFREGWR